MPGLSVSDVVNVQINMSPLAVPLRNFGALCIAGPSTAIDVNERIRQYSTLDGVAEDFGSTSPEFLAADLFFSQSPRPAILYIGRFAQTGSNAVLHGGIMTNSQQVTLLNQLQLVTNGTMKITIDGLVHQVQASPARLTGGTFDPIGEQDALVTALQGVTAGGFAITIDGAVRQVSGINFSLMTGSDTPTLLGSAGNLISTALSTHGTATWDTTLGAFVIRSATSGAASTITYATAPAAGTDVSVMIQLTAATGALPPVAGATGMDFTNITNLNGAASIINNALSGGTCWFDGTRFSVQSVSSGTTSSIGYASPAGVGQDVSIPMKLTQGSGASAPVNGIAAETALDCAIALRAHPQWYGLQFALVNDISVTDYVNVAEFIEGCDPVSIFGYTSQDSAALDPTATTDIFSQIKALGYTRTFGQFSSNNQYASASMYGRAFTVDFEASDTVITLKFKQEPGVAGEILTETQAASLNLKRANVFVYYSNDVAIIQQGVMASGMFFDERHNSDWLANRIQTDLFNVLYTAPSKIPQTNQGIHILVATVENSIQQGVVNGMIAPGQWNAPGFGQIAYGQMLPKGFYVWAPLVESQPQAIREQRIAPTIQAGIKLAGAVHFANVIVNVNR
jgi:hypothetical protein